MAIKLGKDIENIFSEEGAIKVLATIDGEGVPHVVFKNSLHLDEDGNIVHLEVIESSQTNKNLVRSIWFNKTVAINIRNGSGESWQIKGKTVRAHISGPVFEKYYKSLREKPGDIDLSTVWIIEPQEAIEESFLKRKEKEEKEHPLLIHLDRIAK